MQFDRKKFKILLLFALITLGFLIFIGTLFYWAQIDRRLPKLQTSDYDTALRGDIISSDGYTIATSKKLYKVMIDTRNINKKKLDIFVNLYAIYAQDDPKRIRKIITKNKGNVVLSYQLTPTKAKYIQDLSRKFYSMGVFVAYEDKNTKSAYLRGMSVVESGEDRLYPNKDLMAPIQGYVKKIEKDEITKIEGVKGVEKFYENYLNPIQDAKIIGSRDIGNNIIRNRNAQTKQRIDGSSIILSVSLRLQKRVENVLDFFKNDLNAKEIVVAIMKSDTGEIVSLASSSRFDPDNIKKIDYKALNPSAVEFAYEPGSVIKPITLALLLRGDKVNPYDLVYVHKGKYKLGKSVIRDTKEFDYLSAEDIIVHSSNIGILKLAQKLEPYEYYQGLKDFGFSLKSGIDLPYERVGSIPSVRQFNSEVYKATVGYGYGMKATLIQLLRAFNVFNYDGKLVTPHVGSYYVNADNEKIAISHEESIQVIPASIAKTIKRILIKVVKSGSGTKAQVQGVEVGGKTGTAHIAEKGSYSQKYNGSFIGFANDEKNKYTIGVWVMEPKKKYKYFGSQSAAPVFKQIVEIMIKEGYLAPKIDNEDKK